MSVQFDPSRNRWVVRWYQTGRHRSRRFHDEAAARRFDAERARDRTTARHAAAARAEDELGRLRTRVEKLERQLPVDGQPTGIYPYATREGVRWRIAVPRSDGTVTTRRGFESREAAWRARDCLTGRGPLEADVTFARFWTRWLTDKRPYLTAGALEDLEAHGRKRLLPHLGHLALGSLHEQDVREWMVQMAEQRSHRALSAKTINNARAALSSSLADATRQGLLTHNPCSVVGPLPLDRPEIDYLRLDEIDRYLDACRPHYRPLAALLIGTGARVSEAIALTWPDIDLEHGIVRIQRQRARHGDATTPTKGKRSRTVLIGPRLRHTLNDHRRSGRAAPGEPEWLFICPRPKRGRYARRPATKPPSRKTVHEWHEHALATAGLRDVPLHALRHTAAATWLSTGHSLIFVARQLGHRSITTTEHYYGHLELNLFNAALEATDRAITDAGRDPHD
jgi:integrase